MSFVSVIHGCVYSGGTHTPSVNQKDCASYSEFHSDDMMAADRMGVGGERSSFILSAR
jgi:hypothetical protein